MRRETLFANHICNGTNSSFVKPLSDGRDGNSQLATDCILRQSGQAELVGLVFQFFRIRTYARRMRRAELSGLPLSLPTVYGGDGNSELRRNVPGVASLFKERSRFSTDFGRPELPRTRNIRTETVRLPLFPPLFYGPDGNAELCRSPFGTVPLFKERDRFGTQFGRPERFLRMPQRLGCGLVGIFVDVLHSCSSPNIVLLLSHRPARRALFLRPQIPQDIFPANTAGCDGRGSSGKSCQTTRAAKYLIFLEKPAAPN